MCSFPVCLCLVVSVRLAFFEVRYQFYRREKLMWAVVRHYTEQVTHPPGRLRSEATQAVFIMSSMSSMYRPFYSADVWMNSSWDLLTSVSVCFGVEEKRRMCCLVFVSALMMMLFWVLHNVCFHICCDSVSKLRSVFTFQQWFTTGLVFTVTQFFSNSFIISTVSMTPWEVQGLLMCS